MSYRIYTAGKMAGLSSYDQMEWRKRIEISVRRAADIVGSDYRRGSETENSGC